MDEVFAAVSVLSFLLVSGGVGYAIGARKARGAAGAALGVFVGGPPGWILAALLLDYPRKCPACQGGVPVSAVKCQHCGADLAVGPGTLTMQEMVAARETRRDVFECPSCGAENMATPQESMRGIKCGACGADFVPRPLKKKEAAGSGPAQTEIAQDERMVPD